MCPKYQERTKFTLLIRTQITSQKVYGPAAWLYMVVAVKSDTRQVERMHENACICVLNTENHTLRSGSVFCPENKSIVLLFWVDVCLPNLENRSFHLNSHRRSTSSTHFAGFDSNQRGCHIFPVRKVWVCACIYQEKYKNSASWRFREGAHLSITFQPALLEMLPFFIEPCQTTISKTNIEY